MCLLRIIRTIEKPVSLGSHCLNGTMAASTTELPGSSMARPLPSSPPSANHTRLPYGSTAFLSFYRMELPSRDPTLLPSCLLVLSGHSYSVLLLLFNQWAIPHGAWRFSKALTMGVHTWGTYSTNVFSMDSRGSPTFNTTEFRIKLTPPGVSLFLGEFPYKCVSLNCFPLFLIFKKDLKFGFSCNICSSDYFLLFLWLA